MMKPTPAGVEWSILSRVDHVEGLLRRRLAEDDDDFVISLGMVSAGPSRIHGDTLLALLENPTRVRDVPRCEIPALLLQLASIGTALAARLEQDVATKDPAHPPEAVDRLLTPEQAAELLGVSATWLRRHWRRYRFARKLSRKTLRFSETGLRRWIAAKMPS